MTPRRRRLPWYRRKLTLRVRPWKVGVLAVLAALAYLHYHDHGTALLLLASLEAEMA